MEKTGDPLDIIFGNGMGRNFLFLNFKEQKGFTANFSIKVAPDSIKKVPLQTENESDRIWNASSDKYLSYHLHGIADSIKVDSLTISEKKRLKDLAMQVPDSIRSRFSFLLSQWNFAISHNPKTLYSANTYSYVELPEFNPLKSMGEQIIPLIMERLMNPSDFYLLALYEAILKNGKTKTTCSNDYCHFEGSEQSRAISCVKMWLKTAIKKYAKICRVVEKFRGKVYIESLSSG